MTTPSHQAFRSGANSFFQLVFCGTAATIVSGAVAERVKVHIIYHFLVRADTSHLSNSRSLDMGRRMGLLTLDSRTSPVIPPSHSVGGWAALAGAMLLGPRIGKYDKNKRPRAIPGHSMSLAVIGLFVLWLGWFWIQPWLDNELPEPV